MARVKFLSDWSQEQDGDIRAGDSLLIEYVRARPSPGYVSGYTNYNPGRSIIVSARFHPHGQEVSHSVDFDGSATVRVPSGATKIELWFKKTDEEGTVSWDSQYGQNYWFDVT
ncbi:MAG: DUF6209 family protein [Pseudonocardiaceae bacterium]